MEVLIAIEINEYTYEHCAEEYKYDSGFPDFLVDGNILLVCISQLPSDDGGFYTERRCLRFESEELLLASFSKQYILAPFVSVMQRRI